MTGKSVQRTDLSDALWHAGESLRERKSSWRILKTHTHRWMRNMMWHPPVQPDAEIEEEYNELNELNSLIEETIAARNAISDRSAGFKEQIRLNDIALEYRDYTDAGAEYDKLKELIANRSKDDEEIIESMHRLAALKYRFYTEKRALNLEGLNRAEETAADIKSEYEAEKEKVRALFAGMSSEKGI